MKNRLYKLIIWALIFSFIFEVTPVWALTKEENIYAKLNSDGSVDSLNVFEHLISNNKTIKDKSSLKNIKSVDNSNSLNMDNGNIVWETNGNDIYYQGETSKNLPITISVKYFLDNEEMKVEEMLGKSGNVKIVLKFQNNLKNYVIVNGKIETLYTPFVVATTSLISNSGNKNITVTNGKVIDNGISSVIVALSSPGLYDSLDLKELKDFDRVVISYDTEDFEMNSIYSVATSKILEDEDLNVFKTVKSLYSSIDLLQSNMDAIVDGSNMLNDGANKLANGTNELDKAISNISNKYYNFRNMDKTELEELTLKIIKKNMVKLVPALEEAVASETEEVIKKNKSTLEKAVVESSLKNTKNVINGEIDRIVSNISLDSILSSIFSNDLKNELLSDESLKELSKVFKNTLNEELEKEINKTTKDVLKGLSNSISNTMSDEEKVAYVQNIATKYNISFEQAAAIVSEVQNDTLTGVKEGLNNSSNTISKNITNKVISSLNDKDNVNSLLKDYLDSVNAKITEIIENDENIEDYENALTMKLVEVLKKEFSKDELLNKYINASNYVDGLVDKIIDDTANDLASKYTEEFATEIVTNVIEKQLSEDNINNELKTILSNYENDINDKLKEIDVNVTKLQTSVSMLNKGMNEFALGMNTLNAGLKKFNKEGINKINSLVNGNVKYTVGKIEALVNLSNDYKTLDEIDSSASGSSKIVYMIDSVKKEKEKNISTEKIVEKKSFWQKVKGLFTK